MDGWPPELMFLRDLEELMKCPICFDLMQAPVLLPGCEHNYCSLCIRRYFSQREQCPTCGNSASSNQLRSNGILEKTIEQFRKIRSPLHSLCVNKFQETASVPQSDVDSNALTHLEKKNSPQSRKSARLKGKEEEKEKLPTYTKSRKRLLSQSGSDTEDSDVQILSGDENSSFSSSQASSSASQQQQSVLSPSASLNQTDHRMKPKNIQSKLFVTSDGAKMSAKENARAVGGSSLKTVRPAGSSPVATSPLALSQGGNSAVMSISSPKVLSPLGRSRSNIKLSGSPLPEVEKVPCPVCGVPVVAQSVNRHLDLCLGRQEKQSATARKEKKKPLPKLVYNLMSDKDIRRRLKDMGLMNKGDRQALIKRHHEFTMYHNADCDSLTPKDMGELVKEFEETQKMQVKLTSRSPSSSQSILRFTKDSKQEDIEKAHKEYAAQHKDQFQSLIRDAKGRMKAARKLPPPPSSTTAVPGPENASQHGSQKQTMTSISSDITVIDEYVYHIVDDDDDDIDDEIVCASQLRTTSVTKKSSYELEIENDVTDDEVICPDKLSNSGTTSEACRGSASDEKSRNVLTDDAVIKNRNTLRDTSSLSPQSQTLSTKRSHESAKNDDVFEEDTDVEEEIESDVSDCEAKSQTVQTTSSVRAKGKRMLKPTKPSWQDTEWAEPSQNLSKLNSSHQDSDPDTTPSSHLNSQKKSKSDNSHIANSGESLCQEDGEAQRISDQLESVTASERDDVPLTGSSLGEGTVTEMDIVNDKTETLEPSTEHPPNADGEAVNSSSSATDRNKDSSDPVQTTAQLSKPEDHEELTVVEQENMRSRKVKKTRDKGKKRSLDREKQTGISETDSGISVTKCVPKENHHSDDVEMVSSREVNMPTGSGGVLELEDNKIGDSTNHTSGPQITSDCFLKNNTECFDLDLSDIDDEPLSARQNTADSSNLIKPDQSQDQEQQGMCESDSKNNTGPSDDGNADLPTDCSTEDDRELPVEVPLSETDQITESSSMSSQNKELKSVLRKKVRNDSYLKKSVRFVGLRPRLSDIGKESTDPTLKEKPKERRQRTSAFFKDTTVTRAEAKLMADMGKVRRHQKSRKVKTVTAAENENDSPAEAEEDLMSSEGGVDNELDQCASSTETTSFQQDQCQKTSRSTDKKKKAKDKKGQPPVHDTETCEDMQTCSVESTMFEDHKKEDSLQNCEASGENPMEEKDATGGKKETSKGKKKKRKQSALPTIPEDYTGLESMNSESVCVQQKNTPENAKLEISDDMVQKKDDKECCQKEGDTPFISNPLRSDINDLSSSSSAITDCQTSEQNLSQTSHRNTSDSISKQTSTQRRKRAHSEPLLKSVLPTSPCSSQSTENPEEAKQSKSKYRRKRAESYAGKLEQQTADAEYLLKPANAAHKRRKTSRSCSSSVLSTIPEIHADIPKLEQQDPGTLTLQAIPETNPSDILEKQPSRSKPKKRKRRSGPCEDGAL